MDNPLPVRLPATPCSADLYRQLLAIARWSKVEVAVLVRLAVERLINEEKQPQSWITLATLDRLLSLAPEMSQALGYPVATDEEVLCELLNHWQRTKEDCYGRESRHDPSQ